MASANKSGDLDQIKDEEAQMKVRLAEIQKARAEKEKMLKVEDYCNGAKTAEHLAMVAERGDKAIVKKNGKDYLVRIANKDGGKFRRRGTPTAYLLDDDYFDLLKIRLATVQDLADVTEAVEGKKTPDKKKAVTGGDGARAGLRSENTSGKKGIKSEAEEMLPPQKPPAIHVHTHPKSGAYGDPKMLAKFVKISQKMDTRLKNIETCMNIIATKVFHGGRFDEVKAMVTQTSEHAKKVHKMKEKKRKLKEELGPLLKRLKKLTDETPASSPRAGPSGASQDLDGFEDQIKETEAKMKDVDTMSVSLASYIDSDDDAEDTKSQISSTEELAEMLKQM